MVQKNRGSGTDKETHELCKLHIIEMHNKEPAGGNLAGVLLIISRCQKSGLSLPSSKDSTAPRSLSHSWRKVSGSLLS